MSERSFFQVLNCNHISFITWNYKSLVNSPYLFLERILYHFPASSSSGYDVYHHYHGIFIAIEESSI
jgi:hypothetical protein